MVVAKNIRNAVAKMNKKKSISCKIHPLNSLDDYKYVVVLSKFKNQILLSRHSKRETWETQGGHIEKGETPLLAAQRELFEESGASQFSLRPIFDYWAGDETNGSNGMVFAADIETIDALPQSEMAEIKLFDHLPQNLTYPEITPKLFKKCIEENLWPLSD